jgi:hypothetical protein
LRSEKDVPMIIRKREVPGCDRQAITGLIKVGENKSKVGAIEVTRDDSPYTSGLVVVSFCTHTDELKMLLWVCAIILC